MTYPSDFNIRALSLMATTLIALAAPPPARADTDALPQTIGGEKVVEIAGGAYHSCARVESGRVWCWGENEHGQLGDGTTTVRLTPAQVQGLTGVTQLALGAVHSCALRNNGRVFCWGGNVDGQIGDGTTTARTAPVRVTGLTEVTGIAAGAWHSCAVRNTGRVFCWGWNAAGQLGDGTTTTRLTPVRVEGSCSMGATQIEGGALHSCLLRQDGQVACWGHNEFGQLGDGTTTFRLNPVPVQALSNVQQLAMGSYHGCALRNSGRVFCWGWNDHGQLGDGTLALRTAPVRVRVRDLTTVTQISSGAAQSWATARPRTA